MNKLLRVIFAGPATIILTLLLLAAFVLIFTGSVRLHLGSGPVTVPRIVFPDKLRTQVPIAA